MGMEIEEILTVVDNNLPHDVCVVADNGGTLTRESKIIFEPIDETSTRLRVGNRFSGEYAQHLVKQTLYDYTQQFLETFKAFAESRLT